MKKTASRKAADKVALITGVTGQDGAYLSELLLKKGYTVHGLKRRASLLNTNRVDHIYEDPHLPGTQFILHYGDTTDATNIIRLIQQIQPTEIYHLAAQSHVHVSFEMAEYTANADALGTLRVLEAIRLLGLKDKTRFYQASTSEMYGNSPCEFQNEDTPFQPVSPYGAAKLYAYWMTVNYRKAYGLYACNGILFNHESPLRGETFVSKKVTKAVAMISKGMQDCLYIGNLDAQRDWGHAKDYVYGMYLIMQYLKPDDFVLATGRKETVRYFIEKAFEVVDIKIEWQGEGVNEIGVDLRSGKTLVKVDPHYFRATELDSLQGDYSKAKKELNWEPKISFEELVKEMIESDIASIGGGGLLTSH